MGSCVWLVCDYVYVFLCVVIVVVALDCFVDCFSLWCVTVVYLLFALGLSDFGGYFAY